MKRLESQEDYLEKILQISKEKDNVHAIDVARGLSFSKPSVSVAMNKLKDQGYIEINSKGEITLNPSEHVCNFDTLPIGLFLYSTITFSNVITLFIMFIKSSAVSVVSEL